MEKVDDLTREKLREWQMRRLEIKDRIQAHPEQTLALSKVLDLMDEEHAQIMSAAQFIRTAEPSPEPSIDQLPSVTATYQLHLNVSAHSAEDLRRLLDMAVHELQRQIEVAGASASTEPRRYPGGMTGSLGGYQFEVGVGQDA
ncbi:MULTISPECIES: hypothetical protein [unclassified Pseudomonas]|uniref:hypothetical protein n=1 Tax=unclassified Pseudomonas TaxID=196821 RepID=UPI002733D9FD|nr:MULTISPECIES: hypothetical protein [unclassified Pseudomonas]WLH39577.1 hypothetical protein PSH94_18510 [Pseudomonas sp. FP2254]